MSARLHHASRCGAAGGTELSTTRLSTVCVCQLRHDSNKLNLYRRRDSNPHCLVPKTSASSRLGYAGMVNPAGLEPATCRLGNDCSYSAELRVPRAWLRRQDLNLRRRIMSPSLAALRLQCTPRQTFQTGYGGRIRTYINEFQKLAPLELGHSVRFLNWWTWHDLNVRPRPSQSRALIPLSYRSVNGGGGRS